jgi:predicted enzyme related to lactoylglutathione lyase
MNFKNAISWFEIPSTDLARATKFYETIFNTKLVPMDFPNIKMRMFPLVNNIFKILQ